MELAATAPVIRTAAENRIAVNFMLNRLGGFSIRIVKIILGNKCWLAVQNEREGRQTAKE